jgi:hypothetical protein
MLSIRHLRRSSSDHRAEALAARPFHLKMPRLARQERFPDLAAGQRKWSCGGAELAYQRSKTTRS